MSGVQAIFALMLADLFERVRRFSFLVVTGVTAAVGYSLIPSSSDLYNGFVIYGYRGVYNSSWIGTVFGLVIVTLLSLIGFYLIRDAVNRDYQTRVGHIIATTPITRLQYALGKWLSNLAVLAAIMAVLSLMALIMYVARAEDPSFSLVDLLLPIWAMGLPVMAWVAALAVLFETTPILRSTLGDFVFPALWMWMLLVLTVGPMFFDPSSVSPTFDFLGTSATVADLYQTLVRLGFDLSSGTTDLYQPKGEQTTLFQWDGTVMYGEYLLGRLLWLVGSLAIVAAAALSFDRFDPARRVLRHRQDRDQRTPISAAPAVSPEATAPTRGGNRSVTLTPLGQSRGGTPWLVLIGAELRLMLAGKSWWWYAGGLSLIIASLAITSESLRVLFLGLAWIWPTLVWSQLGNRERVAQTEALIFTSTSAVAGQLIAVWLAGTVVGLLFASGFALRLLMGGQLLAILALAVGALFLSALALTLGVWSGSARWFQVLYPLLWYLGLSGRLIWLDYKGVNPDSIVTGIPLLYLILTASLVLLAMAGRRHRLTRP